MIRRLKRIEPLSLGKITAALYGLMSLLFVPFLILFGVIGGLASNSGNAVPGALTMGFALVMAILMPVIYAGMGFLVGLIGAVIYNFAAKHLGGIEVEVE